MIKHIILIGSLLISTQAYAINYCHKTFCPPKQTVEKPDPVKTKK